MSEMSYEVGDRLECLEPIYFTQSSYVIDAIEETKDGIFYYIDGCGYYVADDLEKYFKLVKYRDDVNARYEYAMELI